MTRADPHSLQQRLSGIQEVECVTPDLNGVPRGKVMTAAGFLAGHRLQLARGVLLQCIMGGYPPVRFYGGDDGDLRLTSATQRVYRLPWRDPPRALAICDADELDGRSCGLSTRTLLKRVLADYAALGWAPVVATEVEFFVFELYGDPQQPFRPPPGLNGQRESGGSAFSVSSGHGLQVFFDEVYAGMAALGLPRDTFLHEMGVSQFEINLLHGDALQAADQTFLFKHLLREVGLKHGLSVVFMAKPLAHAPGSSMHLHQSVVESASGRNIFTAAAGEASPAFYHFIGGLQATLAEFTLLFAPHVNSYQRFSHPFASPNNACWSYDNRAAGLRIPASAPEARRVENRLPGVDGNPYLVLAASLAAGLHGLREGLQPMAPVQGEFEVAQALRLPATLQAALAGLQGSRLARQLFGAEFIDGYIASKSLELASFLDEITPWERRVLAGQA